MVSDFHAGPHRLPIDHDRAGAAQGLTAAKLGAGQSNFVTQEPEQRKRRIAVPALFMAVYLHFNHDVPRSV
jgi:hypothetical protein